MTGHCVNATTDKQALWSMAGAMGKGTRPLEGSLAPSIKVANAYSLQFSNPTSGISPAHRLHMLEINMRFLYCTFILL